jgi:hypothetical protein
MMLLLEWMSNNNGQNYSCFNGENNCLNKKSWVEAIAQRINAHEVIVKETGKQVLNKLSHLEATFCLAHNFAISQTGAGLLADDDVETFQKAIEKRCPYHIELLPSMEFQASAQALANSDNLDNDNDGDDSTSASNPLSLESTTLQHS